MLRYITRRLALSVLLFLGITVLIFILMNLAPGGPADVIASSVDMSQEAYEELIHSMGLDKPVLVRYGIWLGNILRGDLGISTRTNQEVSFMIGQRIVPSLSLMLTSLVLALVISIPLGTIAACRPYSVWDNLSTAVAFLGTSSPNFFIALILIYFLAVQLRLLPAQGMYDQGMEGSFASLARHMILPAFVLAFQMMGNLIKQTRSSVLEVLGEEYVRTARAKGISEFQVITRHVLRNALMPIVTMVGSMVPFLVGGAVITEQIFSWAGIGSLMVQSIISRDYDTIMGIAVVVAIAVIVTNIVLDIVYSVLDPKVTTG